MLLAVDVGNTQTHFGTFTDGELVEHWRFATVPDCTRDELAVCERAEMRLGVADIDGEEHAPDFMLST